MPKALKEISGHLNLASKLARFLKFLFPYYFNQGNIYVDKI